MSNACPFNALAKANDNEAGVNTAFAAGGANTALPSDDLMSRATYECNDNTASDNTTTAVVGSSDLGKASPPIVLLAACRSIAIRAIPANGRLSRRPNDERTHKPKLVTDIAHAAIQLAANTRKLRQETKVGIEYSQRSGGYEQCLSPE